MSQTPTTDEDEEESKSEGDNGGSGVQQAGRALDQAESFIDDFIQSHIDLVPNFSG